MLVRILLLLIMLFSMQFAFANDTTMSLKLQDANLADVIRQMARWLSLNVIVSSAIQGTASIELNHASSNAAFDLLLAAHDLGKWQYGNIIYIAPRDELIKRRQDQLKWQELSDEAAPLESQSWQLHYAKAQDIFAMLEGDRASLFSKRGHARIDARTNVIFAEDIHERIAIIARLIHQLDVPVQQILISARLVSVDSDYERELGVIFGVKVKLSSNEQNNNLKLAANEIGGYSLAVARLADGSLLDVKLSALEKAGHANLISNPSLFTANQQLAAIESGEEVPYQEQSENGGTAVTFKKAVLGLKVTPQILPKNRVLLQLQINQDRPSNRMVQGVPTITTRQMITNVLVKNGETIVLGGIYETNRENGEQRLPFLSQIPFIGELFSERMTRENKRELLIFVTPTIMM
ncbi:MAG: type IV pilus (Tfp) assembly protein PilQ [uncultured bacterium]|nr:MAG: type IV pilus (Tfp) assembly protein PilQ [uncultured bacterium]